MTDYRATFPALFAPAAGEYDVQAQDGKVYRIHAPSPGDACERIADLHRVAVVAWRTPRAFLQPGVNPAGTS